MPSTHPFATSNKSKQVISRSSVARAALTPALSLIDRVSESPSSSPGFTALGQSNSQRISNLQFWWMGGICLLVVLHREESAAAACAAGLFSSIFDSLIQSWPQRHSMKCEEAKNTSSVRASRIGRTLPNVARSGCNIYYQISNPFIKLDISCWHLEVHGPQACSCLTTVIIGQCHWSLAWAPSSPMIRQVSCGMIRYCDSMGPNWTKL